VTPGSLFLLVLMAGVLFLLFSRSRRQQRVTQRLQAGLDVGARVMTTAGLYATVIELQDGVVVLQTGPGQTSRWDRRAIAEVLPDRSDQDAPPPDVPDGDEAPAPDGSWSPIGDPDRAPRMLDTDRAPRMRETEREDDGRAAGTAPSSQEAAPPDRA
jgi:preprotein translocase subunit YajC